MPVEKDLFLFDSNNQEEEDSFGIHTNIAQTIFNCINKTELSKSAFTIGLFGSWGSGKSFIINEVKKHLLNNDNYEYLYIDVWKYIGHPLSRSILFDIDNQLRMKTNSVFKDGYKNDKKQSLEQILYCDEEITDEVKLKFDEICKSIINFVKIVCIILLILFLGLLVNHYAIKFGLYSIKFRFINIFIDWISPFFYASFAMVSAPLILAKIFEGELRKLCETIILRRTLKSYTCKPVFSPEQFEKIYKDIIKKINKKTIIVFDNLDRCEPELAYETLSTIKTFMDRENCFYIIPCDDKAIKNYIAQKYNLQDDVINCEQEFFDKLFNTYLRIPILKEEDRDAFIEKQLNKLSISETLTTREISQVKSILFYAYKGNTPRQIKRFLNDLAIYYALALNIDKEKSFLLLDLPVFIIMMVIKQKWSNFEEYLLFNPTIIDDILINGVDENNLRNKINDIDEIISFLKNIRVYLKPNISFLPYIHLKENINNDLEIKNALINGEIFTEIDSIKEIEITKQANIILNNENNPAYTSKLLISIINSIVESTNQLYKLAKLIIDNLNSTTIKDILETDCRIYINTFTFLSKYATNNFIEEFKLNFCKSLWGKEATTKLSNDFYIEIFEYILSNNDVKFEDDIIINYILNCVTLDGGNLGVEYAKLLKKYNKLTLIPEYQIVALINNIDLNKDSSSIINILKGLWDKESLPETSRKNLGKILSNIMSILYQNNLLNLDTFAEGISLITLDDLDDDHRKNLYTYMNTILSRISSNELLIKILVELIRFNIDDSSKNSFAQQVIRVGIQNFIKGLPNDENYLKLTLDNSILQQRIQGESDTYSIILNKYKNLMDYYQLLVDNNIDNSKLKNLNKLLSLVNELELNVDKKVIAEYYLENLNNYNVELKVSLLNTLYENNFKPNIHIIDNVTLKNNALVTFYDDPVNNYRLLKSISNFLSPSNFSKNYLEKIFNKIKNILVDQGDNVAKYINITECINEYFIKNNLKLIEDILENLLQGGRQQEEYKFAKKIIDKLTIYNSYNEGKFLSLLSQIDI